MTKDATIVVQQKKSLLPSQETVLNREEIDRLYEANVYLVQEIACEYVDFDVALETLIEEGLRGFEISLRKYDPTKDFPFSDYAKWWIKRKISDVILVKHNLK